MKEIARLVVDGWPSGNLATLEKWLLRAVESLKSKGERAKFLTTPGGFSLGKFPKDWDGKRGWNSNNESLNTLIPYATPVVNRLISPALLKAAKGVVQYITLNVDLRAEFTDLHAELIALIDVSTGKVLGWTGKSYPTMCQEKTMVHVTDPETHLFKLGSDRVVLLGCHDLNIFNGRARANQKVGGARHQRCEELLKAIVKFKPTHILQHPHGTDTWKSWNQSWKQVNRQFPNAYWSSAITYAANRERRAPLSDVLDRLHHEGSDAFNVIIKGRKERSLLQRDYLPV